MTFPTLSLVYIPAGGVCCLLVLFPHLQVSGLTVLWLRKSQVLFPHLQWPLTGYEPGLCTLIALLSATNLKDLSLEIVSPLSVVHPSLRPFQQDIYSPVDPHPPLDSGTHISFWILGPTSYFRTLDPLSLLNTWIHSLLWLLGPTFASEHLNPHSLLDTWTHFSQPIHLDPQPWNPTSSWVLPIQETT